MTSAEAVQTLLSDLLDVDTPTNFFEIYYGNRPCHLRARHRRPAPFSWNDLNRILRSHRLPPPRVRVAHSQFDASTSYHLHGWVASRSQVAYPVLRRNALQKALASGATLIIDAVQELDEKLNAVNFALSEALQDSVGMNCYASFREDDSFGPHWDEHDVFAYQLAGQKHWTLFHDQAQSAPVDYMPVSDTCPSDIFAEITLNEGDVLYVPRGFWHDVTGVGRETLHISIGVARPRAVDVLRRIIDGLESDPVWGATLPRFVSASRSREFEDELQSALAKLASQSISINEYLDDQLTSRTLPLATNLPWSVVGHERIDEKVLIVWLAAASRIVERPGQGVLLRADGLQIELDPAPRRVIDLISLGPRNFGDLSMLLPDLDRDELQRIIRSLAKRGLVELVLCEPAAGDPL